MATHKVYEHTLPGLGGRRHHSRFPIPADVAVIPLDGGDRRPFWATAEDISARGVFVKARRQVRLDGMVVLEIVIRATDQLLRVQARVVHRIAGLGFGCQFVAMTSATRQALGALVASRAGQGSGAAPASSGRTAVDRRRWP